MRDRTSQGTVFPGVRLRLLSSVLLSVASLSVAAQNYQVIDLGVDVSPLDINYAGTLVGTMSGGQTTNRAFILSLTDGVIREIAPGTGGRVAISANAVNDAGVVVGNTDTGAFMAELGTIQQDWDEQGAWGISNTGLIAGNKAGINPYRTTSIPYNPAIYEGNGWTVMDIAGVYPRGTQQGVYADIYQLLDINDAGYAVGKKSRYGLIGSAAFLITPPYAAVQDASAVTFLPTPYGGAAAAINNQNLIAGTSGENTSLGDYSHAFLFNANDGSLTDLGTLLNANGEYGLRSSAADINDHNQVVGASSILSSGTSLSGTADYHAFIWENGVMSDLNDQIPVDSGWILIAANAINEQGDIVGTGLLNGEKHGYVLTVNSVSPPITTPPENQPPVAIANADVTLGKAPLTVNFTAADAFDPEGLALSYVWDFGDGNLSTEMNPTHLYKKQGVYLAMLSVTDPQGLSDTVQLEITVKNGKR